MQIMNKSGKVYRGADKGTNQIVNLDPDHVHDVSVEMASYLTDTWPENWEVVVDEEPEPEHETRSERRTRSKA